MGGQPAGHTQLRPPPAHVEDSGAPGWAWEGQCPCCAGPPDPTPLPSCLWLHTEKGPGCGSADQTGPWVREMGRSLGPRAGRQLSFPGLGMPATLGLQPAGTQPCCPAVCWRRATGGRTRDTQLRHTGLGKGPAAQRSRDPSRAAEGPLCPVLLGVGTENRRMTSASLPSRTQETGRGRPRLALSSETVSGVGGWPTSPGT